VFLTLNLVALAIVGHERCWTLPGFAIRGGNQPKWSPSNIIARSTGRLIDGRKRANTEAYKPGKQTAGRARAPKAPRFLFDDDRSNGGSGNFGLLLVTKPVFFILCSVTGRVVWSCRAYFVDVWHGTSIRNLRRWCGRIQRLVNATLRSSLWA